MKTLSFSVADAVPLLRVNLKSSGSGLAMNWIDPSQMPTFPSQIVSRPWMRRALEL